MALQLPGYSIPQTPDAPNLLGLFQQGYNFGGGIANESEAKRVLGDYVRSLYGRQQPQQPSLAALDPQSALVNGSISAAEGATDPTLSAYFASAKSAESGGNPNAKSGTSSASGLYGFTDGTWNSLAQAHPELGLTSDGKNDPAQQERAMRALTMENARALSSSGQPVNPGTLYASHFLGAPTASNVLGQPDDAPMSSVVSPEVVQANPFLAQMTVGQFKQWAAGKGGNGNGGYAAPTVDQTQDAGNGLPPRDVLMGLFRNPETRAMAVELVKQAQTGGTGGELGLNPQYGVDANGNPVLLQLGKNGQAVQTALPAGVSLSKEPIKIDAGTKWVLLDPITRQPVGEIDKNTQQEAYLTGFGTAEGKAAAERIDALPGVLAKSDNMLATIDGILTDPALDSSTGWLSWMQGIPNTDQYRFGQRALQLQGQSFLQAFESLKGGGQITEVEGAKATQAIGRLSTAQKAEDYRSALNELKGIVTAAKARAQKAAGVTPTTDTPAPKVLTYNANTGELE